MMTESRPSRETIRELAGQVAATAHPRLDEETIDQAITVVETIENRLETNQRDDAIEDLLAFWDGYIAGGLRAVADVDTVDPATQRQALIRRGNEADLYGLDLYQALLNLAEAHEESDDGSPSDRTRNWAERVATLTGDFVGHLDDHR